MNIAATQYSLKYSALEIYLSGCAGPHCDGCHNPELWDFSVGESWRKRLRRVLKFQRTPMVQWVWVLGGEPLDQPEKELSRLLTILKKQGKPVVLFTHYELKDIPLKILNLVDFVKVGAFIKDRPSVESHGIVLSSDNQKVLKLQHNN